MSNFFANISGNKMDLDDIFTKKNNNSPNNVVTGFICNGQDLGERYHTIPEGVSSISYKYDITGQYTFNHKGVKKDFMDIFSQQAIYEFVIISSDGYESTNNDIEKHGLNTNVEKRKGLGATFRFILSTDKSSTFQIGKIEGGNITDVISYDSNSNVHQNGGKGGDGIVIYIKKSNGTIGNICFIGGGGGAGGFNSDHNYTGDDDTGVNHSIFGKGGHVGTNINFSNNNFDFYYGGQGGYGLEDNGISPQRNGGAGGEHVLLGNYFNEMLKYNGEDGYGESLAFGGGGGGGGYYHGYGGLPGGNSTYPHDSASGGGAGGSKIIKNTSQFCIDNNVNIHNVNVTQNNIDIDNKVSITVNNMLVNSEKILKIENTIVNDVDSGFNPIENYTT